MPFDFPTLTITNIKDNINDYELNDFIIENYQCQEQIKMKMRK